MHFINSINVLKAVLCTGPAFPRKLKYVIPTVNFFLNLLYDFKWIKWINLLIKQIDIGINTINYSTVNNFLKSEKDFTFLLDALMEMSLWIDHIP